MLVAGIVAGWYVYVGQPFSFMISGEQARALLIVGISGALILAVCRRLAQSIKDLEAANGAATLLATKLSQRSAELEDTLQEQVRWQHAIEISDNLFRLSFEHAVVGKVQVEPYSGKIIRVNQAFAEMLGYSTDDLVGTDAWQLTFGEDLDADKEAYQKVLVGSAPRYIREKRYVKRDGTLVWARASLVIVRSPADNEPLVAVAVVENVDEQHQYRLELELAKSNLERSLRERTEALDQRNLLLREVYHRVKNNLQIVDGLIMLQAQLIKDEAVKSQLQQTRDRIYALGLVHHQLMGSHDLRNFDVYPFLMQLLENLTSATRPHAGFEVRAKSIQVDLDFAIPLGLVVTELVTNSLKHAFVGQSGHILIKFDRDFEGNFTLIVSDNGIGVPADINVPSSRNGLGMKIVGGLLSQMRGKLHREIIDGTTYRIVFEKRGD